MYIYKEIRKFRDKLPRNKKTRSTNWSYVCCFLRSLGGLTWARERERLQLRDLARERNNGGGLDSLV